jgi:hypothetical protein
MFLTKADFNNFPYNLPASHLLLPNFQDYVEKKEKWALERMLGSELYLQFVAGLYTSYPDTPIAEELVEQYWKDLRDGVQYVHVGMPYRWEGMKETLRPLIYALWTRDTFDDHTSAGIVLSNVENGQRLSPHRRIADAFNDFSRKVGHLYAMEGTLYGYLYNSYGQYYPSWSYRFNAYGPAMGSGPAMGYINPLFG